MPFSIASPIPPGIRVCDHGGSTGLSLGGALESGKSVSVEKDVPQGL